MQPYYQHAGITIYHGDCLEVLPPLSEPVDAIICDPPYGTTACSWDTVIPFVPMWTQIKRLVKPRAAVVLFGSQPFTSALVMSNPKWFKWEDIWEKSKPTGFLNADDRPLRAHENILVFCDGTPTYNPQKYTINPIFMDRRTTFTVLDGNSPAYGKQTPKPKRPDDGSRYPISIIPIPSAWGEDMHTTQKPLALMRYLILTYTNPGDLVLDFAMGSGTTLVAAKQLGRKAIGIELDERYVNIAIDRLQQEIMELV
jgi:site-specific DNA-methyltransferase (adenine-specific)